MRSSPMQKSPLPYSLCTAAWLALLMASSTLAGDWSQWRGTLRNGVATAGPPVIHQLPANGLEPVWMATTELSSAAGGGWSSPVVSNGRVYLFTHKKSKAVDGPLPPKKYPYLPPEQRTGMSDEEYAKYEQNRRDEDERRAKRFRFDEITYCLHAATGKVLWSNTRESVYTRFPQSGTPAIVQQRVYLLGAGRVARCLDATTGEVIWQQQLPGDFRDEFLQSSFALADGVAMVLCGHMFGLDAQTGNILWQSEEKKANGHCSPVIWEHADKPYCIVNVGGQTACFAPRTGKELWRVSSQGGHSTPVIVGDQMITYGNSRKSGLRCYRLSPEAAEHEWTFTGTGDSGSSPVVVNGRVYVQGEKRLACVRLADGKREWQTTLDIARPRYTSLVAVDDVVLYTFDGVLAFSSTDDRFQQLMNAKIDKNGLLAEEATFREQMNLDELERTAEGQKESEKLWRKRFGGGGVLTCASPAIADGKLYIRLKNGLACYNLAK